MMDVAVDNTNNLNEAIWNVDLTGINSPTLSFYHAEWADEETALPTTFTGSFNGDGVSISDDGVTWHRVYNPSSQGLGVWVRQSIDLTAAASSAGISLGANFQVKFQQYDNFSLETDGRGYDEIVIYTPGQPDDWYSFSLEDGNNATIGATVVSGSGNLTMELYDSQGVLLATGSGSTNVNSIISQFQDETTDGNADRYYVRVTGLDAEYSLFVTRNVGFDTETNNSALQAQPLSGLRGVLGYATATPDVYSLELATGEELTLAATLPAGGPFLFDNPLATPGGSALAMELRDPSGNLVGMDSTQITHTANMDGSYTLTVFASQQQGEYFISINQSVVNLAGDFDADGDYDCDDIDALVAAIAGNTGDLLFDLTGDSQLSLDDVDLWLTLAGAANLPSGNAYLPGDATLDGAVDGNDFLAWNAFKFTSTAAWCRGDFNADGITDGDDFLIWNMHKFTSALVAPKPEQPQIEVAVSMPANRERANQQLPWVTFQPLSIPAYKPRSLDLASSPARRDHEQHGQPATEISAIDAVFSGLHH